MRLVKLTLCGFKSFADRTEFTFDQPITGIVGPNGCGKSNVVDAVKWVLGERSSKSLRGTEMLDVIFSGSAGRKPEGMASVSLTFDNPLVAAGESKPTGDHVATVETAAEASAERTMGMSLSSLVRGTPVTCRPDDTLREAFVQMNDKNVGSVLVTEEFPGGEEVLGILTRTDLIGRVILPELPLSTRIGDVMTRDVMVLDANATAADATLLMAEHSIRHIPVVQHRGGVARVVGVVSERDLFALQRLSVRQLAVATRRADDPAALAAVSEDIRRLSHHLVAQGVAAPQLTRLISHLNDQLTQRLLTLGCEKFKLDAESFCWLALGSEGRSEQTIATDQDNGILFVEGRVGGQQLLEFADWVNQGLALAGFPLCKGNIMARNPQWCGSAAYWSGLFADWIDRGDPQALLNASVNAYRRLDPHFEAPNQIKASAVDRGSMVRIRSGTERSSRVEVRSVGPDANPYMVMLSVFKTGLEGDTAKIKNLRQAERYLPDNIYDAIANFRGAEWTSKLLGADVKERYADLKQASADRCPRLLGTFVKAPEVQYHHEVYNQFLWNEF